MNDFLVGIGVLLVSIGVTSLNDGPETFDIRPVTFERPAVEQIIEHSKLTKYAKHITAVTPDPINAEREGNCLPVAQKLQTWLVRHNHMAKIIAVKEKKTGVGHALVMYNSKGSSLFDKVIDNGYMTNHVPMDRETLNEEPDIEYLGSCDDVSVQDGTCLLGLAL